MNPKQRVYVEPIPGSVVTATVVIVADGWAFVWLDEFVGGRRTRWLPLEEIEVTA